MRIMDVFKLPLAKRRELYLKRLNPTSGIPDWQTLAGVIQSYVSASGPGAGGQPFKLGSWACQFVEDADQVFRKIQFADKVTRLRHTGWYVDNDQSESTRGVVLHLSHNRFAAGCTDPWNFSDSKLTGPVILEYGVVYDDAEEAARNADNLAKVYGEECREDNAKQSATSMIEDLQTEISQLRKRVIELVQAVRRSKLDPVICSQLRSDVQGLLAEKARKYVRIAKLTDNYWEAVPR